MDTFDFRSRNVKLLLIVSLVAISSSSYAQERNVGSGDWVLRVTGGSCLNSDFRVTAGPTYSIGSTETLNIYNNGIISGIADSRERESYDCPPCRSIRTDDDPVCATDPNDPRCFDIVCSTCFRDVCRSTTPLLSFDANVNPCQSFSMNGFTFRFHRRIPERPTAASVCSGSEPSVSLNVGGAAEAFQWEISKNIVSGWILIPGKSGNSISISHSELLAVGFTQAELSGNLFARVKDPSCAVRVSPASFSFILYKPAPQFEVATSSPWCSSGANSDNGIITVTLLSGLVTNYKVTLSYEGNIQYQESFLGAGFPLTINKSELLRGGITGLSGTVPGDWTVTVQNDDPPPLITTTGNCGATQIAQVPSAAPIDLAESGRIDVKCFGESSGEFVINITNGTSDFTYHINGTPTPKAIDSPVRNPRFDGLAAGSYDVFVTDFNGCRSPTITVSVSGPTSALIPSIAIDRQISCHNGSNGELRAEAIGGQPGYTFAWAGGQTDATINGLSADSYEVIVTDARGCVRSESVILENPLEIDFDIEKSGTITCPGDQTAILEVKNISNSNGDESYAWSVSADDSNIVFDIGAGTYSVMVADRLGCFRLKDVVVEDPPSLLASITAGSDFNGSPISCNGESDGVIEVSVTKEDASDPGPLSYQWDTPEADITSLVSGLGAGVYEVQITDVDGCSITESYDLVEPNDVVVDLTVVSNYNGRQISCFGSSDGAVAAIASGGVGSFSYLWGNGEIADEISGLSEGVYRVEVSDANGCVVSNSISVAAPPVLTVDIQHPNDFNGFDITCNGLSDGSARAFLTGGTAPYTYSWSGGQSTETINGLVAGIYSVNAFDANNCAVNGAIEIMEPASLSVVSNVDVTVSCNGFSDAEVSLLGIGGAGDYSFSSDGIAYQTSNVFTNLNAGTKDFYLRDGNSCVVTVQETLLQPDPLAVTFQDITDATCNDPVGSALAVVTGGNGGFTYQWYDDPTNQFMNAGSSLVNAIAGIYRVEITDVRNCQLSDLVAVSSIGGAEFDIQNIVPVTCFGYSDGAASINVISGITPLSFSWSNGQTTQDANNLLTGNYFATVTDGLGCRTIKPLQIVSPAPLATSFIKVLPNCVGDCDGSIEVSVSGGTGPYSTDWTTLGQQTNLVSGLCAGQYDLTIADNNNCVLQQLVDLSDPEPLKVNSIVNTPICLGRCDGSIEVVGQGGTGPYVFEWLDGPSSSLNSQLCPGDYQLTMTDAYGCTTDDTIKLPEGAPLPVDLGTGATLCVGQVKMLDPGNNWVAVEWTSSVGFSSTSPVISIAEPGDYFFKGVDAIGCIGLDEFRLSTSLDLLTAEFLMVSEAQVGDTLVAIDISWPLPERVEWIFPLSFTRLPSSNPDFLFAVVPEPGTYMIGMQSFLAECRDLQEKELVVRLRETTGEGGRLGHQEDLIRQFSIFPNPNDGNFDVSALLSEPKTIDLKIISFPRGIIESHLVLGESDFHQVSFELSQLSQGIYLVLLTTGDEQRVMRFIKTN